MTRHRLAGAAALLARVKRVRHLALAKLSSQPALPLTMPMALTLQTTLAYFPLSTRLIFQRQGLERDGLVKG